MKRDTIILTAAIFSLLSACGSKEEPTPPPEEGVFDPMVDTIERAREVETQVEDRVKEMNSKLEEMEGND